MSEHETIADIIAWLRRPREGENAYLTLWRDEIADRLKAAHKRERGDSAKLREALVKCREIALQWQADEAAGVAGTTDKPHARSAAEAVVDMEFEINAALAEPVKNCEKGTVVEQTGRVEAFRRAFYKELFLLAAKSPGRRCPTRKEAAR